MKKLLLIPLLALGLALPPVQSAVTNTVLFIGQVVRGATVGAPLAVSSTGLLTSGLSITRVTATADTTSTATTDTLINGMTITPPAGTYLVWFNSSYEHNTNNTVMTISIWAAAAQVTGSEVRLEPQIQAGLTPSLNITTPGGTHASATVNGSQAIEARWRNSAGTGTMTAHARAMTILRVQ